MASGSSGDGVGAVTRDVPQSTVSGPPAGQPIEPSGTKQTLKEMVDAIKQELELGGSMASVIRQANELMGLAPYSLTLPEQAEQLMSRLGVWTVGLTRLLQRSALCNLQPMLTGIDSMTSSASVRRRLAAASV
jgi:hypothetical protein